ncbi:MAG: hypothetical protein AVDCRST_MAG14-1454, partial [uncultured Rubrobacteraceae bacterium]
CREACGRISEATRRRHTSRRYSSNEARGPRLRSSPCGSQRSR